MENILKNEWITDLGNMTCKNKKNNIVVMFKKHKGNIIGRIKNLPLKTIHQWTTEGVVDKHIKKTVTEAEIIFIHEYCNNQNKQELQMSAGF